MATEFEPGGQVRLDTQRATSASHAYRQGRHWSTYVILALLAVVIGTGIVLTLRDQRAATTDAINTTGMTVGSAAQVPPPVNRP